ncbi:MAG: DUF6886 family protein [Tepidiformaceae bacterium]
MLYHFSEEPGIELFEPRRPPTPPVPPPGMSAQLLAATKVVWAIDAWHSPVYYFPRECPRICFWPLPGTNEADRRRWMGDSDAPMVACIEEAWLERLSTTTLYRYHMPEESFRFFAAPGMWLSEQTVVPTAVAPVGDLIAALRDAEVELRVMESLQPLRGIWDSSLHASGIRLRNARGWSG